MATVFTMPTSDANYLELSNISRVLFLLFCVLARDMFTFRVTLLLNVMLHQHQWESYSYFLIILDMPKFEPYICNVKVTLIISPDESRGYIGFRSVAPLPPP